MVRRTADEAWERSGSGDLGGHRARAQKPALKSGRTPLTHAHACVRLGFGGTVVVIVVVWLLCSFRHFLCAPPAVGESCLPPRPVPYVCSASVMTAMVCVLAPAASFTEFGVRLSAQGRCAHSGEQR